MSQFIYVSNKINRYIINADGCYNVALRAIRYYIANILQVCLWSRQRLWLTFSHIYLNQMLSNLSKQWSLNHNRSVKY